MLRGAHCPAVQTFWQAGKTARYRPCCSPAKWAAGGRRHSTCRRPLGCHISFILSGCIQKKLNLTKTSGSNSGFSIFQLFLRIFLYFIAKQQQGEYPPTGRSIAGRRHAGRGACPAVNPGYFSTVSRYPSPRTASTEIRSAGRPPGRSAAASSHWAIFRFRRDMCRHSAPPSAT